MKILAKAAPLALAGAIALAPAGCTVVVPGQDAGIKPIPFPIPRPDALPPPKPLEASVLYVVNLERSSANLAAQYGTIMVGLANYLTSIGLQLDNMGVISTYADTYGPRLLLGRTQMAQPGPSPALLAALAAAADAGAADYASLLPFIGGTLGNVADGDIPVALNLLASSGRFDGDGETSEAKNVLHFGSDIDVATLPPALGGIDRSALFDRPRDLFIVVYLQPLGRRCALGGNDCLVDGSSPADLFTATGADGGATWLQFPGASIKPEQVVQLAIATSEGESIDAFRTRCAAVPGFPKDLFDVIAPSTNAYFTPLMADLNAAHPGTGHTGDLCDLLSSSPQDAIKTLGNAVAAAAGSH
jgi:hypothetical protein